MTLACSLLDCCTRLCDVVWLLMQARSAQHRLCAKTQTHFARHGRLPETAMEQQQLTLAASAQRVVAYAAETGKWQARHQVAGCTALILACA